MDNKWKIVNKVSLSTLDQDNKSLCNPRSGLSKDPFGNSAALPAAVLA